MSPVWRIALVVDPLTAVVGGGRHMRELSRELLSRGHQVRAFGAPPSVLHADLDSAGASPAGPSASARGVKVGASVLSFQPDALIGYDALSPAAWLGARLARRLRVPLVLVEPGLWGQGKLVQRALWRVGETLWGRYVRHTAGAVIALDAGSREAAVARGFTPGSVALVPHGVDTERFRPGLASDELARRRVRGRVLSYVGPLDGRAEIELLIAAFARTVGQRDDWSLVIGGHGPTPPRLRACAERLGIGARTHFFPVADPALPALLSSSTLFAEPSLAHADAPLMLARAMACGVPVLAGDHATSRALIEPGVSGLLAPRSDLEAWVELVRRAASSPDARRRWGAAARGRALERFAWPSVAAEFERAIAAARAGIAGALDAAARDGAAASPCHHSSG